MKILYSGMARISDTVTSHSILAPWGPGANAVVSLNNPMQLFVTSKVEVNSL
jgi:hypothetical protein